MPEVYPRNQPELEKQFENEADCRSYLEALRWPDGYRCPKCAGSACWRRKRELIECSGCGYETSVIAGTVFQDTKLPLKTWFRAMWLVAGQKSGLSALTLQRDLGLGSYKTAWSMLHKMRLAMVRPGRERLSGNVEVDETYWGAAESGGAVGRLTHSKSLIAVAAQCDGAGIGRIRLARIPDTSRATLHQFIAKSIEPGSTVITDGLHAYRHLEGYHHERLIQRREASDLHLLPRVHRVVSLLKRWLLGIHQGAVSDAHLNTYLGEFTFRFNRRKSASRGKLFYRLAQQAVQIGPTVFSDIVKPQNMGLPESRK
jgi:transposase-like protein